MAEKEKQTEQLETWTGKFGNKYIERNDYEDWKLSQGHIAFSRMLRAVKPRSILEVGSNIGLNLIFLNELYNGRVDLFAVEPFKDAYDKLMMQPHMQLKGAWNCSGYDIPLDNSSVDLVFTNGVLIHVAPDDLGRITDEIVRVSKKYILCSEYFAHTPEEKPYHGQKGLLFKRDFGAYYQDKFPQLKCIDYGFLWQRELEIFDNLNWWLFEKES